MAFLKQLKMIEKSLLTGSLPKTWKPHIRTLEWNIGCFCVATTFRNIWVQNQKSLKMAHFIRRNKIKLVTGCKNFPKFYSETFSFSFMQNIHPLCDRSVIKSCTLFLFEKSVVICEKVNKGDRAHFDFKMVFKVGTLKYLESWR